MKEIEVNYPRESMDIAGFIDYKKTFFHSLKKTDVVINANSVVPVRKKHVILEELVQSLGLMHDSERYSSSIFYDLFSSDTALAPIDKELIQLLYNYDLPIGLSKGKFIQQVLE